MAKDLGEAALMDGIYWSLLATKHVVVWRMKSDDLQNYLIFFRFIMFTVNH